MATQEEIVVCHLGRLAYEPAQALQEQIQERLIAAKRA
ncbi:MAG: lipoyl(octanoyl) transferase, partial [Bacteroidetes bacterium QH_10_64_19]